MISGAAADPSCPQASDQPDKSMISYQKGEKDTMKKQTKIAAVLSAAAFMTMVSGLPAYAASYGWVTEGDAKVYYDEDGYLTTDAWRKRGEDWYYLGENGQIVTDAKIDEYYVDSEGKMVTSAWVELKNEEDPDSPETPDTFWYYFEKDGKSAVSKWVKFDSKWYYFDESGHMATGKTEIDGATYYLGTEKDGAMKTGWIRLEENSHVPGSSESWYYFNSDGKMVKTQYDKKIDGNYYTFIDGKMQTGWVLMPSGSNADATGSNAAVPNVTDYQYYGPAGDGKRAEGFHSIEGISGIHEADEMYTFCFKAGKPYVSTKKGNSLFTINAKKYAFSDLGIMQTGRQIVNVANDEIANFCFGADGIMKTGKQTIFNEETGETENWFFHTDGDKKGQGYHGLRDGILYVYGKRQDATAVQRYAPADLNGTTYLVGTAGNVQKASASSTSSEKPELGRGYKDIKDANGTIWTVNTAGVVQ